ncbi:trihelix transcription factor ENAP1-like [Phragmites australis]|uniref:trihelix transcription factor ENAP1-like n=1 Tax=Phragmites australis TaxID=29695 RepID=UPI002D79AEE9|nr:trihelix transcription factor ENAP1-like [Phragmites australis]
MDGLPDADAAPLAAAPPQKRDEWSESGIVRLLEAYEAKWLLRNRAKLKWSDWVDIAREVSAHCAEDAAATGKPGGNSAKTPNQCKNKIESMKKRYRAESAAVARAGPAAAGSSWRFFVRMDGLLKGPAGCSGLVQQTELSNSIDLRAPAKAEAEVEADFAAQLPDAGPCAFSDLMNIDDNGSVPEKAEKVGNSVQKESRAAESDANVSSPRSKVANEDVEEEDKVCDLPKKRKSTEFDIAKSIELLASSFLKIEHAKMEMFRETERMRVEAEIKKGEMELKRTEIMAKTQLQIAKLFAKRLKECSGKTGGSSSVTAEVDTRTKKGENGSG